MRVSTLTHNYGAYENSCIRVVGKILYMYIAFYEEKDKIILNTTR